MAHLDGASVGAGHNNHIVLLVVAGNFENAPGTADRNADFILITVTLGNFGDLITSEDTELNELVGLSAGFADTLLKFGGSDNLTYDKTPILEGCRRID